MPLVRDFPQGVGNRYVSIIDHVGPASYAVIVTGSPPTGGDVLNASEAGMKFITAVSGQLSDDGQYSVDATEGVAGGQEPTFVRLIWMVANTGAQATAATVLSARSVRLIVWGR